MLKTLVNNGRKLIVGHLSVLQSEFTKEDVRRVMFCILDDKHLTLMVSTIVCINIIWTSLERKCVKPFQKTSEQVNC